MRVGIEKKNGVVNSFTKEKIEVQGQKGLKMTNLPRKTVNRRTTTSFSISLLAP